MNYSRKDNKATITFSDAEMQGLESFEADLENSISNWVNAFSGEARNRLVSRFREIASDEEVIAMKERVDEYEAELKQQAADNARRAIEEKAAEEAALAAAEPKGMV